MQSDTDASRSDGTQVILRGGGVAKIGNSGSLQLVIPGVSSSVSQQSPGGGSISSASSTDCASPVAVAPYSTSGADATCSQNLSKPSIVVK